MASRERRRALAPSALQKFNVTASHGRSLASCIGFTDEVGFSSYTNPFKLSALDVTNDYFPILRPPCPAPQEHDQLADALGHLLSLKLREPASERD
jgi:hypothetical protein